MRTDIAFSSDGVTLRGWLYRPDGAAARVPAIVMAHGFSATKEMDLPGFAEVFCQAGFAVLLYDHRNLGASDGQPRGEIDPWAQIRGYRDAITYAQTLPGIDPARIGAWGSSYSGGHVIVVGAIDRRVKCVVSQVPLIDGYANVRRQVRADIIPLLQAQFDADRAARFRGEAPATIPVVAEQEAAPGFFQTDDCRKYFLSFGNRTPNWRNLVTLRTVEMASEYNPGSYIDRVSPTPLLMAVGLRDTLAVADLALDAFARARPPKRLVTLDCNHFDPYSGAMFAPNAAAQREWFVEHLKP